MISCNLLQYFEWIKFQKWFFRCVSWNTGHMYQYDMLMHIIYVVYRRHTMHEYLIKSVIEHKDPLTQN